MEKGKRKIRNKKILRMIFEFEEQFTTFNIFHMYSEMELFVCGV